MSAPLRRPLATPARRRFVLRIAAVGAALAFASTPGFGAASGSGPFSVAGTTEEAAEKFLRQLQDAVRDDKREALASMIRYPARVAMGARTLNLRSRPMFLANYAAIMTPDLRKTILAATPDDLWANWQGVMFADGRVWFRPDDAGTLKIITINQPVGAPAATR